MNYGTMIEKLVGSAAYRKALHLPEEPVEDYVFLARGEYNINLSFRHPVSGQALILRINTASQMHLEKQVTYEANALELLQDTGRVPKVYYVDDSKRFLDKGILVMEHLPGVPLVYEQDLLRAAPILADIHSQPLPKEHGLIQAEGGTSFILEECLRMFGIYASSPLADGKVRMRIERLLERGHFLAPALEGCKALYRCLINTELNASNFLLSAERDYLIDWEKPVYGLPAQDLGHFLAPTTTFWKTDSILSTEQCRSFMEAYMQAVSGRFDSRGIEEASKVFVKLNCLRGLTWCAMAWVEYRNEEKEIRNESTRKKLDAYLHPDFLALVEEYFT